MKSSTTKKIQRSAKLGNGARSRNVITKQKCIAAKNVEKSGEMSGKFHVTLRGSGMSKVLRWWKRGCYDGVPCANIVVTFE